MKKIVKALLPICIVAILCAILVACNGDGQSKDNNNQDEPSQISIFFYKDALSGPYEYKTSSSTLGSPTIPISNPGYSIKGFQDENGVLYYDFSTVTDGLKLFIIWEPIEYTVVLHYNGASSKITDTEYEVSVGSVMPELPMDLKLKGFNFNGWYRGFDETTKNGKGTLYTNKDGILDKYALFNLNNFDINENNEIHLYAGFTEIRYTVSLIYNDNKYQNEELSVREGADISSMLADRLADTGEKQVVYWSLSSNGEAFNNLVNSDITLYAIWKRYCHVNVELNGGELDAFIVRDGETLQLPTPIKIGYDFDGWFTNNAFSGNPISSITYANAQTNTYFAKWSPTNYIVTYIIEGEANTTETITIEDVLTLPTPQKIGYTFIGWCREEDKSDVPINVLEEGTVSDVTLYAKFQGNSYNINLNANGGIVNNSSATAVFGDINNFLTATRDGYVFAGWFSSIEDNAVQYTDKFGNGIIAFDKAEDTTLYAHWSEKYYVIITNQDSQKGTVETEEFYIYGDVVTLTAVPIAGFVADYYMVDGERVATGDTYTFTMPASNVDVEIYWTHQSYTVTLSTNGTLQSYTATVKYDENYTLPIPVFNDFDFKGWFGRLDGVETAFTDEQGNSLFEYPFTDGFTLTSKWTKDGYSTVSTAEDLLSIKDQPGGQYILINDVNLKGAEWSPISVFSGILDGNGYKVYNFMLTSVAENVGFVLTNTGTIKNLELSTMTVSIASTGNINVGVLCVSNSGAINNCTVKIADGEFVHNSKMLNNCGTWTVRVSPLVAINAANGIVINCHTEANVTFSHSADQGTPYIGDPRYYNETTETTNLFLGSTVADNFGQIKNCSSNSSIQISTYIVGHSSSYYNMFGGNTGWRICNENIVAAIGDIAGKNEDNGIVELCASTTTVEYNDKQHRTHRTEGSYGYGGSEPWNRGTADTCAYIGGIVGWNANGKIVKCSSNSKIKSTASRTDYSWNNMRNRFWIGGICGSSAGEIEQSKSSTSIEAIGANNCIYAHAAGIVGNNSSSGKISDCYAMGNISVSFCAGGFVAENYGVINRSYSTVNVTVYKSLNTNYTELGGFVAYNGNEGSIIRCFSTGNITFNGEAKSGTYNKGYYGNFCGRNLKTVSASYYKATVTFTDENNMGTDCCEDATATAESQFASNNFIYNTLLWDDDIWAVDGKKPKLKWE
ncbi:MAG: InlB B-repeat-containing protein [Clostridia bacterium]|nr:InlB B-repeat-containing protein [Clostridia bacterium]